MKHKKATPTKDRAPIAPHYPAIGTASNNEMVILRNLEKMNSEIRDAKAAVWAIIIHRNAICSDSGYGLTCDLNTGEIRRVKE